MMAGLELNKLRSLDKSASDFSVFGLRRDKNEILFKLGLDSKMGVYEIHEYKGLFEAVSVIMHERTVREIERLESAVMAYANAHKDDIFSDHRCTVIPGTEPQTKHSYSFQSRITRNGTDPVVCKVKRDIKLKGFKELGPDPETKFGGYDRKQLLCGSIVATSVWVNHNKRQMGVSLKFRTVIDMGIDSDLPATSTEDESLAAEVYGIKTSTKRKSSEDMEAAEPPRKKRRTSED